MPVYTIRVTAPGSGLFGLERRTVEEFEIRGKLALAAFFADTLMTSDRRYEVAFTRWV